VRQDGEKHMLVLGIIFGDDFTERRPDEFHQSDDFVKPQIRVQVPQPESKRKDAQERQNGPRLPS
jgi:hypothetical protein